MTVAWTRGRRRLALAATWLVATTLLVLCARTVDWARAGEVLATARLGWIVVAIAANAAILLLVGGVLARAPAGWRSP